eukprot:GAHX01001194.1.p1 GENE.GAHX01001194.1~~GAHX01001194.1.p1  ORF type:complete len:636 (-),score=129.06 GAHX01001194.1:1215-3122(-)
MAGFFEQASSEEEWSSGEEKTHSEDNNDVCWSDEEEEGHIVVSHLERIIGEIGTEIQKAEEYYQEKNYPGFLVILNSLYKKGEKIRTNLTNGSLSCSLVEFKNKYIDSTEPDFKKIKTKLKRLFFEYEITEEFSLNESNKLYELKLHETKQTSTKQTPTGDAEQKTKKRSDEYAKWYEEFKTDAHSQREEFFKKLEKVDNTPFKLQVYIFIMQQLTKPDTRSKQSVFVSQDKITILRIIFNHLVFEVVKSEGILNQTELGRAFNWVVVSSLVSKVVSSLKYYHEKTNNKNELLAQIMDMVDKFINILFIQSNHTKDPIMEDKINEFLTLKLHYLVFNDSPNTDEIIRIVSIMKDSNLIRSFRREFAKVYSVEINAENIGGGKQEVQYIMKAELLFLHHLCNIGNARTVYDYLKKSAISDIINYTLPYTQVLYNRLLAKVSVWLFKSQKYQLVPKFSESLLSKNYYDLIGNSNTLRKSIKHEVQANLIYMETDKLDIDQFIVAYFISVAIINVKKIYNGKRVQSDHKHFNKIYDTLRHSLLDAKLGESNVEKLLLACIYLSNKDIDKACSWISSITGFEDEAMGILEKVFRVEYAKSIMMSIKHSSDSPHTDLVLNHTGVSIEDYNALSALNMKEF